MTDIAQMSEATQRIALAITMMLKRRKMPEYRLAELAGFSRSSLNRRMNGDGEFTVDELSRIARVFRIKSTDLLSYPVDPGIPILGTVPGGPINIHWQMWDSVEACEDWEDRAGHEHRNDAFALRVRGESMEPRIPDGARIICYPIPRDAEALTIEGVTVVVTFDEEHGDGATTVGKWVTKPDGSVVLRKENSAHFDPIPIDVDHVISISTVEEVRYRL